MEYKIYKSRLILIQGDITKEATDAIVNAANNELTPGGGVSGAIHRAAGPMLWKECQKLDGCKTGQAKLTGGYNLPAKFVVHIVGPIYSGTSQDKSDLTNAYRNSLKIASENNIKSIAFPSISTGIYGYPIKQASEIAISAIVEYLRNHPEIELVKMVTHSEKDFQVYLKTAEEISDKIESI